MLFQHVAMKRTVNPGPGPDTQIVEHGKGTNVVVVLNESTPSVAVTQMIDDPITRGLRKAGMFSIAYQHRQGVVGTNQEVQPPL